VPFVDILAGLTTFIGVVALLLRPQAAALRAERGLFGLRVGGEQLMFVRRTGNQLFSDCRIFEPQPAIALVSNRAGKARPFSKLFYQVEGMRSGMHTPDGLLWIRRPAKNHFVHKRKIPLLATALTRLFLIGVIPLLSKVATPLRPPELKCLLKT
jgi:hypothetical protein